MKKFMIIFLSVSVLIFLMPYLIIINCCDFYIPPGKIRPEPYETISVYISSEDKVVDMNMSQYLKEVVASEMPAEFESEALKAQATAARTYLVNRKKSENKDAKILHKGADICTDSTHCKAWISETERKKLWGEEKSSAYWQKISDAVEQTSGVLILYNNSPISAVFHSTSSGFTENACDVWGSEVPYLVSVESKGEENSPRYQSDKVLPISEFKSIAENKISGIDWNKGLFTDIKRSEAGGIISLKVGGVSVKGTEFRSMYELRSTNVDLTENEGNIYMQVTGFGHGVGMSQYGANYLASQGMTYIDILKTYYTNVQVV